MTRQDAPPIIHDGKSCVQVGVVAEHVLYHLVMELVADELLFVRLEIDIGTVLVLCRFCCVALQFATLKDNTTHLSLSEACHLEMTAQGIHGLNTDTIQSNGLLECLGVKLTAGIEDADRLHEFSLRDATTVVAYADAFVVLHIHFNTVASLHLEFIDGVVEHFLQQHIDTVLG